MLLELDFACCMYAAVSDDSKYRSGIQHAVCFCKAVYDVHLQLPSAVDMFCSAEIRTLFFGEGSKLNSHHRATEQR